MSNRIIYLKNLFVAVSLFCITSLVGQAPTAEKLQVDALLLEAERLDQSDSSIFMAEKALELSQNEQYAEGIIASHQLLANLQQKTQDYSESLRHLLQLIPILDASVDKEALYQVFIQIGDIYLLEKLSKQALTYYQRAKALKQDTFDVKTFERIEMAYSAAGFPDSALLVLDQIYNFYTHKKSHSGKTKTLEKRIDNYLIKEDYQSALEGNQQLLELVSEKEDDREMATVYNNIAYNYIKLKAYQPAIDNFKMAKVINDYSDLHEEATLSINMAICYHNLGDSDNAIRLLKSAQSMVSNEEVNRQSMVHQLISTIYLDRGDSYNALLYNGIAMDQAKHANSAEQLSATYRQAGEIHEGLYDFESALQYYTLHLQLQDSLATVEKLRQQGILQQQLELERAEKEIRLYQINEALKDSELRQSEAERSRLLLERDNFRLQAQEQNDQLSLLEKDRKLQETLARSRQRESDQAYLLLQQRLRTEEKDRELTELQQQEQLQRFKLSQEDAEGKIQEQKLAALTREQQVQELELQNQRRSSQLAYGIGAGLFLISILVFINLLVSKKSNKRLSQKNEEVEKERSIAESERQKSDELLLNILPEPTALELKEKGSATPKRYELTSVLFTDFSSFTSIAEQFTAEQLVRELNFCFTAFDEIIERHNMEKIKTMGDGYMCVGGVPISNKSNPVDAVSAALEMQQFIQNQIQKKQEKGIPYWGMRIGIHSGSLVAGVVGTKKFAYDIWGDTVNIASRMESGGMAGKVNISKTTYEMVKDHFTCTYRGSFEVKNKGEIDMYFVEESRS